MLLKINIQNFALIDSLQINFHKGLQVITGETGAGKSIIIGALRLILGERAEVKSIANSEKKSIVEAEFLVSENLKPFFEENDLDFEPHSIIRREILPTGKSRAFVNDAPVTLDVLKNLSEKLIDIHSQFETSDLFKEEYQFKMIDGLSDNQSLISEYQKEFSEYRKLKSTLEKQKLLLEEGKKESDYKAFLLQELEETKLDEMNLEELQIQLSTQENAGVITENLALIFSRLDQEEVGILDALNNIKSKLSKVGSMSHQFTELEQRLESNFLEFKDIVFELHEKAESVETNPQLLEELNDRINKINALFSKHYVYSLPELIEIRERLSLEQNNFAELEISIEANQKNLSIKEKQLEQLASKLSENRKKSVPIFTQECEVLFEKLGLEKAKISVQLTGCQQFTNFGKETIEILFQANSGFPLKPIQSAISGGERSRVMLAIKKIMSENAELPTLILDEIDTGVSGKIANEIGNVMKEMSENMQLIVITHLAQVAAKGDYNYKVVKDDVEGITRTNILPLNPKEKLNEIAQLLSGSTITDAALLQAKELMK